MSKPVAPVTGAPGFAYRREIHDLAQRPYEWSLFIRAMTNIQDPKYTYKGTNAFNWEQMASIHGLPFTNWAGDPNVSPEPVDPKNPEQWHGYCNHGTVLFPTWHRAVTLLVEQSICQEAEEIAKKLAPECSSQNEIEAWGNAAKELRFPYWDWTLPQTGKGGVPSLIMDKTVTIIGPNSVPVSVSNPLHSYDLHGLNDCWEDTTEAKSPIYFKTWKRTYRWPNDVTPRDQTESQPEKIKEAFVKGGTLPWFDPESQQWLHREMATYYTLLQKCLAVFQLPMADDHGMKPEYYGNVWNIFSNTAYNEKDKGELPEVLQGHYGASLESPHNKIHLDIGGYGHMADANVTGFDPIFYLHHANIDRIYAFWAFIYEEYWMDKGYLKDGKNAQFVSWGGFDRLSGTTIDHESALSPFRTGTKGNPYWSSEGLRSPKNLGYAYLPIVVPGTEGLESVDITKTDTDPTIRRLYRLAIQRYFNELMQRAIPPVPLFKPECLLLPNLSSYGVDSLKSWQKHRHFRVLVVANEAAFDFSHSIELFIPANNEGPDVTIGSAAIFKRSDPSLCANCVGRQVEGIRTADHITIDPLVVTAILQREDVDRSETSMETVVEKLWKGLRCRVVSAGGAVLAQGQLHGDTVMHGDTIAMQAENVPKFTLFSSQLDLSDSPVAAGSFKTWQDLGAMEYEWRMPSFS